MIRKVFIFQTLFLALSFSSFSKSEKEKKLLNQLEQTLPDTTRLRILGELTEAIDDEKVWTRYNNMALKLATKLIAASDSTTIKKGLLAKAAALNNTGLLANLMGNIPVAIEALSSSLEIRERYGSSHDISESLHNLGTLYFDFGEFPFALEFFERSYNLSYDAHDTLNAAVTLNYIGMIALKNNNINKAFNCFFTSLDIFKKHNDSLSYAKTLDNLGMTFFKNNQSDSAIYFVKQAENIFRNSNDLTSFSTTQKNLAELYFQKNNMAMALYLAKSALALADSSGFIREISNAEELLARIYETKNDTKSAYYHFKRYILFRDSLQNENAKKLTIAEQFKYGFEQKTAVMRAQQEKQSEVAAQKISKQKIIINSFILVAVLMALLLLVIYSRFRLKKISSDKLRKAYADLKNTQQQLIHQEKNASLGQLTAGIAHEIKNPLNFVTNFAELSEELIAEIPLAKTENEKQEIYNDLKTNITKIKEHGKRADLIIQSMLQHSRTGSAEKQLLNVNTLLLESLQLAELGVASALPGFNCKVKKNLDEIIPNCKLIQQDMLRVFLNLFNNAFHAVEDRKEECKRKGVEFNPELILKTRFITSPQSTIIIAISDNGKGMPDAIRSKIFEPFFTTKPAGKGTGLGLSISYDIIKAHGGSITVESQPNRGTTFTIQLPV